MSALCWAVWLNNRQFLKSEWLTFAFADGALKYQRLSLQRSSRKSQLPSLLASTRRCLFFFLPPPHHALRLSQLFLPLCCVLFFYSFRQPSVILAPFSCAQHCFPAVSRGLHRSNWSQHNSMNIKSTNFLILGVDIRFLMYSAWSDGITADTAMGVSTKEPLATWARRGLPIRLLVLSSRISSTSV